MLDEGYRIRALPDAPGDAPPCGESPTDALLSYRTARFCVDRRLRRDAGSTSMYDTFTLPPAAVRDQKRATKGDTTQTGKIRPPKAPMNSNQFQRLRAEDDEGDVEYKWRLTNVTPQRFEHLVTQMQFRVREGHGQCLYEIGVRDDGRMEGLPREAFEESVETVHRMADALNFECQQVRSVQVPRLRDDEDGHTSHDGTLMPNYCAELLVSRRHAELGAPETSVAFCGTAGSGKSTLMGVVFSESLDDGNGTMSQLLFNHKHEVDSGRTSSLSTRVWSVSCGVSASSLSSTEYEGSPDSLANGSPRPPLTTDAVALHGAVHPAPAQTEPVPPRINSSDVLSTGSAISPRVTTQGRPASSPCRPAVTPRHGAFPSTPARRFISLLDLGSDLTKTTLFGLMSRQPDLVCICVQAGCTNVGSAVLCAKACRVMNKSVAVVITQTDLLEEFELDSFLMDLASELEAALSCECYLVESADPTLFTRSPSQDIDEDARNDETDTKNATPAAQLPIFCVSSVTGAGLDVFRGAIANLPVRRRESNRGSMSETASTPFEVLLDSHSFFVDGAGPVVSGVVSCGPVPVGAECFIGPDKSGQFHSIQLRGIHVNGVHVNEARWGDEASFALSEIPTHITLSCKGKVLTGKPLSAVQGGVRLVVHVLAQELKEGAQPMLYARNARQAVRVQTVTDPPASKAEMPKPHAAHTQQIDCAFLYHAEILEINTPVLLHWAPNGLAVGYVASL